MSIYSEWIQKSLPLVIQNNISFPVTLKSTQKSKFSQLELWCQLTSLTGISLLMSSAYNNNVQLFYPKYYFSVQNPSWCHYQFSNNSLLTCNKDHTTNDNLFVHNSYEQPKYTSTVI